MQDSCGQKNSYSQKISPLDTFFIKSLTLDKNLFEKFIIYKSKKI